MKANLIVGKKQIVLASLVIVLGAAVYINWSFANKGLEPAQLANTDKNTEVAQLLDDETGEPVQNVAQQDKADETAKDNAEDKGTEETKTKVLGDAKLVNAKTVADDTYFVKARLARNSSRDLAMETVATILDDAKLTESDKKEASAKAMSITDIIEAESRIENLIKAKGFEDCMVYLTKSNASIVIKTAGLDQNQATQIKNIIVQEGNVKGENVSISEVK